MKKKIIGVPTVRVRVLEREKEWRLTRIFYVDDLALCDKSEEDLEAMIGRIVEECKIKSLKVNSNKNKVMVLGGEEETLCEYNVYER